MRVFLDTNVLVAAFATRGLCADLVRTTLAEHQLITGEVVLTELREVLARRLKLPTATLEEILRLLREQEVVPKPPTPSDVPVRDPDDRWILASATAGRADVLVTGDQDLLDVADAAPLPILDPRGFWNLLSRPSPTADDLLSPHLTTNTHGQNRRPPPAANRKSWLKNASARAVRLLSKAGPGYLRRRSPASTRT